MIKKHLKDYGFSEHDIAKMCSLENMTRRSEEAVLTHFRENSAFLESIGVSKNDIIRLANLNQSMFTKSTSFLKKLYDYFKDYGFNDKELCNLFGKRTRLVGYGVESIIKKMEVLERYFSKEKIVLILSACPQILCVKSSSVEENISFFQSEGYAVPDIERMCEKFPIILTIQAKKIVNIWSYLESLGLKVEEIKKMIYTFPNILGLNIINLKKHVEAIEDFGYSKDEMRKMLSSTPTLLGLKLSTLREKLAFYDARGLRGAIITCPSRLIQSLKTTTNRIKFMEKNGIGVNAGNLFVCSKRFKEKFGVTNADLQQLDKESVIA